MTTWTFNVLKELLAHDTVTTLWIEPDSAEEAKFVDLPGLVLGKCHHFNERLQSVADLIIYSYRDLRTAAVSYRRKFGSECSYGQLHAWTVAMGKWTPHAHLIIRYEDALRTPLDAIANIRTKLGDRYPLAVSASVDDALVLQRVEGAFEVRQQPDAGGHDAQTMILPRHRTFQPSPNDLTDKDKRLYDFVDVNFQGWLRAHNYLEIAPNGMDDYGQETEYRIAELVLRNMPNAFVVDVGVEKGSFIDLARHAGAHKIVGFEALPRHIQFLADRFDAVAEVKIYPLAISNQRGTAQFHVALDREGNELDYHHTLSDLGDSATVVRSSRSTEVQTDTINALVNQGVLSAQIDFLKIDTDGHDLAVLQGLGEVRPTVVMAEFWDTLPQTSGKSPYSLRDLSDWAKNSGYVHILSIRRHDRIERIEFDASWTIPGDWGNVFFFRPDFPLNNVRASLEEFATNAYKAAHKHIDALVKDCEEKEIVIRRLDAQVNESRFVSGKPSDAKLPGEMAAQISMLWEQAGLNSKPPLTGKSNAPGTSALLNASSTPALSALHNYAILRQQLEEKEAVIREQSSALQSYRAAFTFLRPLVPAVRFARNLAQLAKPKLGNLHHHPPIQISLPPALLLDTPENPPTISIVTPSFRQGHFIERTIRSVLEQKYPRLEFFVQDGGSMDDTVEVLRQYEDRLSGWASTSDEGQSHAINLGFARTKGEIMAWLNSDDILLPGALAQVANFFRANPEVDVVYGHRILINEADQEIGRWVLPPHNDDVLSWADFVPQETLFWRRRIWDKVGGIDESFRFAMDWDLLLRFRDAGARMVRIPHFLGAFRVHDAQKTSAVINDIGTMEMQRLRQRALGREVGRAETHRAIGSYLLSHMWHDLAFRVKRRVFNR